MSGAAQVPASGSGGGTMLVQLVGHNLLLPEVVANRLLRELPRFGVALWEFDVEREVYGRQGERGTRVERVRVPVSRRLVRAYRTGDGRVLVAPQGDLVTIWRALLKLGKGAGDIYRLVRSTPFAKRTRQLEVSGVYGPGGSLPLAYYLPADEDYPEFGKRTPAGRYVRHMRKRFAARPIVSEVGITLDAAVRLAKRLGLDVSDPKRAAAALADVARRGELLLVLRRMPLTDPMTGFVIAFPVIIDTETADVRGDMVWLPPDIAIILFGDEDGDRYYVDLAASGEVADEWVSRVDEKLLKLVIRQPEAFWTGAVRVPAFVAEPEDAVSMTGLYGAAALAGVLSVQGVGPLFSVVYRVVGAIDRAGYHDAANVLFDLLRSAALVSSNLNRVFEPLFDARKRLVAGKSFGKDPVSGEDVAAYSLPYAAAIIESVRSSRLSQVAQIMGGLADALLADDDKDARATGELVRAAVDIMNDVVRRHGDIEFALSRGDSVAELRLRDIDLFAATSAAAPLVGDLLGWHVRPVLPDARPDGAPAGLSPYWWEWGSRQLEHVVGGDSFVGLELPLSLDVGSDVPDFEESEPSGRVLSNGAGRLTELAKLLPVLAMLPLEQRAPRNQRDAELFHAGGYAAVLTEAGMRRFDAENMAIVDPYSRFEPVYLHTVGGELAEKVFVYVRPPLEYEQVVPDPYVGAVVRVNPDLHRLPADRVLSDKAAFKLGLGVVEHGGRRWYRWHLLMLVAHKTEGISWTGKYFINHRYALVSVYATPWFDAEPGDVVSGCRVVSRFGDREEWLPGRFDAAVVDVRDAKLVIRAVYMPPQVVLLSALLGGLFWNQLGVLGGVSKSMAPAVRAVLQGATDPGGQAYGAGEAVRVQRAARELVYRFASQSLVLRHEYSELTAPHVTVFGDLLRAGLGYAGVAPDQDVAMHRFNKLVSAVVERLYGADAVWYPRKGGQNRIIGLDLANAYHWQNLLSLGGQEWYRFVRETPGLMSVPASVRGRRGIVHPMLVALVDAPGLIQPADGKSSSETAYLFRSAVDYVEQERSQLVELVPGVSFDALVRPLLQELKQHGFGFLRAANGGLVDIDGVLAQSEIDFAEAGVAHRVYEASITGDVLQRSVQFWAVSRGCPSGAKVVLLDGMIKSFATVVVDRVVTEDGSELDAVFSGISARKKQAWGLLLNGAARAAGIDPEPIWLEYRRVLAEKRAELGFDVTVAGKVETEAMLAAFAKARELGVEFRPVKLYVERAGKRRLLGEAFVGIVNAVFIDDTSQRDDDSDEAGFNGTVLFSAYQFGVPYQRRFIKSARAVELSRCAWYALSRLAGGVSFELDAPVFLVDGGDDGGGHDPVDSGAEIRLVDDASEVDTDVDLLQLSSQCGGLGDVDDSRSGGDGGAVAVDADRSLAVEATAGEAGAGVSPADRSVSDPSAAGESPATEAGAGGSADRASGGTDSSGGVCSVPAAMCLIVGPRQPTPEQVEACRAAARAAVERGLVVMSGGVDGVDAVAVTAAAELGGHTVTILPCACEHNLPGVVEVQPPVDQQTRQIVLENHPNPSALKESHIKLHARNVRMVQRLLSVIEARRAAGVDVKDCIIIALPEFYRGEPSGGAAMCMRLAKLFNIPCRYYVPGEGWRWWHRP